MHSQKNLNYTKPARPECPLGRIEGWRAHTRFIAILLSILLLNSKATFCNLESSLVEDSSNLFENFQKQLQEFKPNAPWIMQELLNLPLKDFFKGFELSILTLAQSNTRNEYFNEKNNIDNNELYPKALWQCTIYEIFLKNIYLKSSDKQIDLFQVTKKIASQNGLIPILKIAQQLDIPQGTHHPMFVFYAFFCDCLVNQFSETIKIAYTYLDNPGLYKAYCGLAVKLNKQIKEKVVRLKNWSNSTYDKTKYETVYADLYEKNQQIINLLKQQSKQAHE